MAEWRYLARLLWFFGGLFVAASGFALIITAGLGAGPWDIFHIGVSQSTGIALSWAIVGTGGVIVLLNLLLGIAPTVGMVLNMLSVGPMLAYVVDVAPRPETPVGQWAMLVTGILLAGLGTALYTSADMGAGPRDGMMIGLTRRLGLPVAVVRNGMEVVAALLGWQLGGPLGLGTVVVALGLGPAVQLGMAMVERLATFAPFSGFVRPVRLRQT